MSRSSSFIRYETRLAIYLRDDWTCVYCGSRAPAVKLSLDHIEDSDDHRAGNLVVACVPCNSSRNADGVGAFALRKGWHRGTLWRRIKTHTKRPIQPYRHCIRQMLDFGMPAWMEIMLISVAVAQDEDEGVPF